MNKEEYRDYLKSDEWKEKRKEFLEAVNHECERCGKWANNIHHVSYDNVGYEDEEDIEVLCHDCHMLDVHNKEVDSYGEY